MPTEPLQPHEFNRKLRPPMVDIQDKIALVLQKMLERPSIVKKLKLRS